MVVLKGGDYLAAGLSFRLSHAGYNHHGLFRYLFKCFNKLSEQKRAHVLSQYLFIS